MHYLLVAKMAKKVPVSTFNPWMLISIAELILIVILIILLFKKKQKKPDEFYVGEDVKGDKDAEVDLGNLFNSMFNAATLHDALKRKIHPDFFGIDPEKYAIADALATQLNENKNNIAKMKEIQLMAIEKLGIKF